ncbi:winged helix-turn-helix domain-containing protein [Tropicimonas sp. S265A]|uniref:winged helix-turn-helix domain-containing protein n=1 Tax=Tropicimonas sp. S265A TaxID=3415134 RepID=UPI003C7E6B21
MLTLRPDPWETADTKAARDADFFASLSAQPDRVGWRLTEDVSLQRVMLWAPDGTRQYPPPEGLTPQLYEFSEAEIRALTKKQTALDAPSWEPFETTGETLLNCRPAPAVCLIYNRALLEDVVGLKRDALSDRTSDRWSGLLAGLAAMFGGLAIWLSRGSRRNTPDLTLNPERHSATRGLLEIPLSARDMKLLCLLQDRDGAVVTKDELYDAGWGREFTPNSRALDQHIINLRRKLDPDKSRPVVIETVHGVGYRMVR